jgi:hypothetical protein
LTTGEALRATRIEAIPVTYRSKVLLDDDVFAEPAAPQFFGVARHQLLVIGANHTLLSSYRSIPTPEGVAAVLEPIAGNFPNARHLESFVVTDWPDGTPLAVTIPVAGYKDEDAAYLGCIEKRARQQFARVMPTSLELGALQAVRDLDVDVLVQPIAPPLIRELPWMAFRARWDRPRKAAEEAAITEPMTSPAWVPGSVRLADGSWRVYRLRGPAVYDAWGNEVLTYYDAASGLRVLSAGPDCHFAFHPGDDAVLTSNADAAVPVGDDMMAGEDNVSVP